MPPPEPKAIQLPEPDMYVIIGRKTVLIESLMEKVKQQAVEIETLKVKLSELLR